MSAAFYQCSHITAAQRHSSIASCHVTSPMARRSALANKTNGQLDQRYTSGHIDARWRSTSSTPLHAVELPITRCSHVTAPKLCSLTANFTRRHRMRKQAAACKHIAKQHALARHKHRTASHRSRAQSAAVCVYVCSRGRRRKGAGASSTSHHLAPHHEKVHAFVTCQAPRVVDGVQASASARCYSKAWCDSVAVRKREEGGVQGMM